MLGSYHYVNDLKLNNVGIPNVLTHIDKLADTDCDTHTHTD